MNQVKYSSAIIIKELINYFDECLLKGVNIQLNVKYSTDYHSDRI